MTDSLAQLLAGGLLLLVAALAGIAGYRIGKRRGIREARDEPEEANRWERRPPRPPSPPRVVH